MKEYKNLINALQAFEEDWLFALGLEACRASLLRQKKDNVLDFELLKSEYQECISDISFDWNNIAEKAFLFSDIDIYNNWQIRGIIEFYLDEFVNAQDILHHEERTNISNKFISILTDNNNWIDIKNILKILQKDYPKLKAYHLFDFQNYFSIDLELKSENRNRLWIVDQIRLKQPF